MVDYNQIDVSGKFKEAIRPDFNPSKYSPTVADSSTTIVWGKPGASPFQENQVNNLQTKDDNQTEIKRKYDVVRIKDPDNSDNHIDVEVMTSYTAVNSVDKSRTTLNFNRVQASENVEVLQRNQQRITGNNN